MNKILEYPNIEKCKPLDGISGKIMKCNRIISNTFRNHLKAFCVTNSQLSILFYLSKGKNINQKCLSDFLFLDKSTVNRNLKRLFESKYISNKNFPLIEMTVEGLTLLESVIPAWERAMIETRQKLGENGENSLDLLTSKLIA